MNYQQYRILTEALTAVHRTTGMEQSDEKIAFTALNLQRMKRVEKQFELDPQLEVLIKQDSVHWNWLVLVESWCGDGAQLLPAIAAIAHAAPGITLTVLLRDENPELMDSCLTNGNRAIPKLICEDASTGERIFTWGPRPTAIQKQVNQLKADYPEISHAALVQQIHLWYAKDKSKALQQDLLKLVQDALEKQVMSTEV